MFVGSRSDFLCEPTSPRPSPATCGNIFILASHLDLSETYSDIYSFADY